MTDSGLPRWLRATELDEANFAAFRQRVMAFEEQPAPHEPRSYPGYPTVTLPRSKRRWRPALDQALAQRRSARELSDRPLSRSTLATLLERGHGLTASEGRGPAPSAGKLCAVELFVAPFAPGWLPIGSYHYDRPSHELRQVAESGDREQWSEIVPSLGQFAGGSLLLILVGEESRVAAKYGPRAIRLMLLEAGHVMQNLCLVASSLNSCALPLGGFFEREIGRRLGVPTTDSVLYVGAVGLLP